jgi:DNA-binding transcriptional MerR regulator
MEKHKAIPRGFMTVGEFARKMNTTVRTLQYYDREGVLPPSAESEGGRRLYTDKDVIRLHQIKSMKYLGFSLSDIKERLVALDTPAEVAATLSGQADAIREEIAVLSETLCAVEQLRAETVKMQTVDWKKYADIAVLLQNGLGEYAWVVRNLSSEVFDPIFARFGEESSARIVETWKKLCDEIVRLKESDAAPDSERGQAIAEEWWGMVTEFTGGDMSMMPELERFADNTEDWDEEWQARWAAAQSFIEQALGAYFMSIGYNPFINETGGD